MLTRAHGLLVREHHIAATRAFDVVIVGGGAAGCVVAARLAENPSRAVLLLEAGPDRRAETPAELGDGWRLFPGFDWGYVSEADPRGVVEDLRRVKLLGGTSWLTRFAYRGSAADYDEWARLGNPGWGFEDVLPYLNRLEADADFGDESWHGDSGPMPITRYLDLELTEIAAAGLEALAAAGFPMIEDHNQPGAVGAGRMPMSSRDGKRITTADAYLPVAGTPQNLTIRGDAQVADVVFDSTRAIGVRLLDGEVISAGSVVLSAGTYGSPAILMRSGVGPAEHLRSVRIPVRLNLPGVGANLADHPGADIDCGYRGPARRAPILHVVATFHSSAVSSRDAPDLMLWLSDPRQPVGDNTIFEVDVLLLKPRSRGAVRLRSADPTVPPSIELPASETRWTPSVLSSAIAEDWKSPCDRKLDVCAPPRPRPMRTVLTSCVALPGQTMVPSPMSSGPARWGRDRKTERWLICRDASTVRSD